MDPFSISNRRSTPKSKSDFNAWTIPCLDLLEQNNYQLTEWGNELENIIDERLYNEDALNLKKLRQKKPIVLPSNNEVLDSKDSNGIIEEKKDDILTNQMQAENEVVRDEIELDTFMPESQLDIIEPNINIPIESVDETDEKESPTTKIDPARPNADMQIIPTDILMESKGSSKSNILSDPILDGTPLRMSKTGIILEHTFSLIPLPVQDKDYSPPLPPLDLSPLYNRYESLVEETLEKKVILREVEADIAMFEKDLDTQSKHEQTLVETYDSLIIDAQTMLYKLKSMGYASQKEVATLHRVQAFYKLTMSPNPPKPNLLADALDKMYGDESFYELPKMPTNTIESSLRASNSKLGTPNKSNAQLHSATDLLGSFSHLLGSNAKLNGSSNNLSKLLGSNSNLMNNSKISFPSIIESNTSISSSSTKRK